MPTPFLGADFFVQSLAQRGAVGMRVRFSHDPLAANPAGGADALNIAQYSIAGPGGLTVVAAATVPDDPQSIDLALSAPLLVGTYTLTVSGSLQTASGRPLQIPQTGSFSVSVLVPTGVISGGAKNDSAEATIRKHLPSSLAGRAWDALIAALAVGDRLNWENAKLAFDQLFKSSASGLYLDRKVSDDGLARPPDIGMPDDLFRRLAIKTTASKLTPEVLLEIMEVFYGSDSLRASVVTQLQEPFVLADGDGLELLLDERDAVPVTFKAEDFNDITRGRAPEVAAAITRALRQNRNRGFALAVPDTEAGGQRVKIYSGSLGLGSSLRVTGGRAQLGLNFPTKLLTYNDTVISADAYNWVVSSPEPGVNRIQLSNGGGTSKVDLNAVRAGDYLIFEAANSSIPAGVYPILDLEISFSGGTLVQYLEISGDVPAHSFLQLSNAEMTFFRPERHSIHQAGSRTVVIGQVDLNTLDVQVPATTQAVGRRQRTAAYLHDGSALSLAAYDLTDLFDGSIFPFGWPSVFGGGDPLDGLLPMDLPATLGGSDPGGGTGTGLAAAIQRVGTTVTVQTSSNHGLVVGDQLLVDSVFGSTEAPVLTGGDPGTSGNPGTSDYGLATLWSQLRTQDTQGTAAFGAVTLADGRLLITGGFWNNGGADLYITGCQHLRISAVTEVAPAAEQYTYHWDAATAMGTARAYHGISLLADGRVLVSGGYNGAYLLTAALYTNNGGAGTWANTGSMATARSQHAQVTLADGRVLVTGGYNGAALSSCEIWDPDTATWGAAAAMAAVRESHTATLLADGRVLVIGGGNGAGGYSKICELYDPDLDTWTRTGNLAFTRFGHTATLLPDGRVLVVGGIGSQLAGDILGLATLSSAEIWEPTSGCWRPAGRLCSARTGHGALYLADKQVVLVAGGGVKAEYFDTRTFRWRYTPNPASSSHSQALSAVGTVAVLHGGFVPVAGTTVPAYLYQPGEDVYEQGGMTGTFRVSSTPSNQAFTYETPDYAGLTTNVSALSVIKPMKAVAGGIVGPFIFDPDAGVAVTGIETEAVVDVFANSQHASIEVADATSFPDEPGWLIFGFGTDTAVAPVKYLGRLSATALSLDYSFRFPVTNLATGFSASTATRATDVTTVTVNLPAGITDHGIVVGQSVYFKSDFLAFDSGYKTVTARSSSTFSYSDPGADTTQASPGAVVVKGIKVTLLKQKGLYVPTHPETVGSFYATASSAGRRAAIDSLESALAAGITPQVTVIYPGDNGLGGAGLPARGAQVLSDKVAVWGGDRLAEELEAAREDL